MSIQEKDKVLRRNKEEEYSNELIPTLKGYSFDKKLHTDFSATVKTISYVGLFFSLFSIVFFPVILGMIGVIIGIFTVINNQRTLGYTTIGFGTFSILFAFFAYYLGR